MSRPVFGTQAADNAAWGEIRSALASALPATWRSGMAPWELDEIVGAVTPILARLVDQARAAEREQVAAYLERQGCCGAPSICGAPCQDSAEADAIARAAKPLAEIVRAWKRSS